MHRRNFLKTLGTGALVLGASGWPNLLRAAVTGAAISVDDADPFAPVAGEFTNPGFTGDEYRRPHDLLWHTEEYIAKKGGRPSTVTATTDVLILGGGLAGLLSAHELRGRDFLLFEQATRFGGNAKSEIFRGSSYSLGPAYVTVPDQGSALARFLEESGLAREARREDPADARVLRGGVRNLWSGATDPAARDSARRVQELLRGIYHDAYPDVLAEAGPLSAETLALDRESAADWVARLGDVHPHVQEYFQLYAWSSLGGSLEEVSAAHFLNFLAAETAGVLAFPGGNGAIARRLVERLPRSRLRANHIVLEVLNLGDAVEALVETPAGELQRFRGKTAIVAAPKYAARFLLRKSIDRARDDLWNSLVYRAYAVANVLLDRPFTPPAFDLYRLQGTVPDAPSFGRRTDRAVVDVIPANWAAPNRPGPAVLTVYRPYPFEGARNALVGPSIRARLEQEIRADLEPALAELGAGSIAGVRFSLWGHSVPLARHGLLADGSVDRIAAPLGERIFFAGQDNYMNPSFEAAFASAVRAGQSVGALLG